MSGRALNLAQQASAPEARALMKHVAETPALLISDFHLLDGSTGVEAVSIIREHYGEMIPAFIVIAIGLDPSRTLVIRQVILSFGIPFALIPLVMFTSRQPISRR